MKKFFIIISTIFMLMSMFAVNCFALDLTRDNAVIYWPNGSLKFTGGNATDTYTIKLYVEASNPPPGMGKIYWSGQVFLNDKTCKSRPLSASQILKGVSDIGSTMPVSIKAEIRNNTTGSTQTITRSKIYIRPQTSISDPEEPPVTPVDPTTPTPTGTVHPHCNYSVCNTHIVAAKQFNYAYAEGYTKGIKTQWNARDGASTVEFTPAEGKIRDFREGPTDSSDYWTKWDFEIYTPAWETYNEGTYVPVPDPRILPVPDRDDDETTDNTQPVPDDADDPDDTPLLDRVPDDGDNIRHTNPRPDGKTVIEDVIYSDKEYLIRIVSSKWVTKMDLDFTYVDDDGNDKKTVKMKLEIPDDLSLQNPSSKIYVENGYLGYQDQRAIGYPLEYISKDDPSFTEILPQDGKKGVAITGWSVEGGPSFVDATKTKTWTIKYKIKTYALADVPATTSQSQDIKVKVTGYTMNEPTLARPLNTEVRFRLVQPKLYNFEINNVKDIDWKTSDLKDRNTVGDMPLSKNANNQYIAHGYYVQFNITSRDWEEAKFTDDASADYAIKVTPKYYIKEGNNFTEAQLFYNIPNENRYNIPIENFAEYELKVKQPIVTFAQTSENKSGVKAEDVTHPSASKTTEVYSEDAYGNITGPTSVANDIETKKVWLFSYYLPSNISVYHASDIYNGVPKQTAQKITSGYLYMRLDIEGHLNQESTRDATQKAYKYTDLESQWKGENKTSNTSEKRFAFLYDIAYSAEDDLRT